MHGPTNVRVGPLLPYNDMIWYDIFVNCNWVSTRWQ